MNKPDYNKNSIVNLMSSIAGGFHRQSIYNPTDLIAPETLKLAKNVVLIILDGLGYEYLTNHCKDSFLYKHLTGKMTSVFPTTTSSAITTFATGVAPQQHAFTGWFMWLKELGTVAASLPFKPRIGGESFEKQKIKIKKLLGAPGFSEQLGISTYFIIKKDLMNSAFNKAVFGKSKKLGYNSLTGFFSQTKKAILQHRHKKFIHAYWPIFDSLSHKYGINSKEVKKHFEDIDKKLKNFVKRIQGTQTKLIITADHGLIDTKPEENIKLGDHPQLKECLILPFCGEVRVNYCYVKPNKIEQFEHYVKTHLEKYVSLHKRQELLDQNYFGLYEPHTSLEDRIGDYVLIAKKNYRLMDRLLGERNHKMIGVHGGLSDEELFVPLILVDC